jgi:hypothetical protein
MGKWRRIAYSNRNSHAELVHRQARIWEIRWEDPDGILAVPCEAHAECMKTGLSFCSKAGLLQHTRSCPLPRIDDETRPDE